MARRRTKKRTHVGANNGPAGAAANSPSMNRKPKSMVIRVGAGEVGPSVSQLVKDVRKMMEPDTAIRLKERRANRLRDYVTMAGPLGVSHLLLFSRSSSGNTNMRLALMPRGPTLHFNVQSYSLAKDIKKSLRNPKGGGTEFLTAPLLVMNNFTTQSTSDTSSKPAIPKHLESLTTTVFQSLFPPIAPQATPLSSIKRVLLLNREVSPAGNNDGTYIINVRHYIITSNQDRLSRGVRRLNAAEKLITSQEKKKKGLPNLGRLDDVADYLLDPSAGGYTSASESEMETDAEVEVLQSTARKVISRREQQRAKQGDGNVSSKKTGSNVERRAVKLVELGPRMKLRMTKVEDGVCSGKVLWHEFITKSKHEVQNMDKSWEVRRKEKEARRAQQKENVERKKREKGASAQNGDNENADDEDYPYDDDDWEDEGLDEPVQEEDEDQMDLDRADDDDDDEEDED